MGNCCKTEDKDEVLRPKKFELSLLNKCHNIIIIGNDDDFDTRLITNILDYRSINNGVVASTNYGFMLDSPCRKTCHYSIALTDISSTKYEEYVTDSISRSYIVLDNIINENAITNDALTNALKESTNFSTTLFIRNNTAIQLDSDIRELIDMIFIKADQYVGNADIIYDQYIKGNNFYITEKTKLDLTVFSQIFNRYEFNNHIYIAIDTRKYRGKKFIYYYSV